MKSRTGIFCALVLGVTARVAICATETDQSESSMPNSQPIAIEESGGRNMETPEVVLQLKYNGGELNKIYLAQFRKGAKDSATSVPTRTTLCTDLCYAGLGGTACGTACQDLVPVGLKAALKGEDHNVTDTSLGEPRTGVCPTLCANNLGEPLCSCNTLDAPALGEVDWDAICQAFCISDRYVLGGCPICDATQKSVAVAGRAAVRVFATVDGWSAWCDVQCRLGQGGAACNCDRSPFA